MVNYNFIWGKEENYIINYKDLFGKERIIEATAFNKSNAEELFKRNFKPNCKIVKIQTSDEFSKEIVEGIFKNILKDFQKIKPLEIRA